MGTVWLALAVGLLTEAGRWWAPWCLPMAAAIASRAASVAVLAAGVDSAAARAAACASHAQGRIVGLAWSLTGVGALCEAGA